MLRLPTLATGFIAVLLLGYWLATFVAGEGKLAAIHGPLPARADYRVTLDFAPERFHQLLLQEKGRLVEVRGNTVFMMDVSLSALRDIARCYWVESVERWSDK